MLMQGLAECIIMKEETIERLRRFVSVREWQQFHTPAIPAKSISIEANELLECFQWSDSEYDLEHVKEELADVLVYCRNKLDALGLNEGCRVCWMHEEFACGKSGGFQYNARHNARPCWAAAHNEIPAFGRSDQMLLKSWTDSRRLTRGHRNLCAVVPVQSQTPFQVAKTEGRLWQTRELSG